MDRSELSNLLGKVPISSNFLQGECDTVGFVKEINKYLSKYILLIIKILIYDLTYIM